MDFTELNQSLEQSHNNLLYENINLQKKLLKFESDSQVVVKWFSVSLGVNLVFIIYLIIKGGI